MNLLNFLLVDDEKSFIEAMARRLRQRDFSVDLAFSGREALAFLEKNEAIDVVVLDVKMPDLDGIQTLEKIKETYPLVEVIMLTGHATIPSAVETVKGGAFGYLTKPCDLDALICLADQAAARKKERETKIFELRATPFITRQEREERIQCILENPCQESRPG